MTSYDSKHIGSINITAKGRTITVDTPLTVHIKSESIQCVTADDLEVWYFDEAEFEVYADRIANMIALSLTDPKEMLTAEANHIVSHHIAKQRRSET